jgi:hypothetical protein
MNMMMMVMMMMMMVCSSGMCNAACIGSHLFIDISAGSVGPMIKGQEVQRESIAWLLKKGSTECPQTSVNNYCPFVL